MQGGEVTPEALAVSYRCGKLTRFLMLFFRGFLAFSGRVATAFPVGKGGKAGKARGESWERGRCR